MTILNISKNALSLNISDKVKLTEILLESLNDSSTTTFDKSWIQTAASRRNEIKAGKIKSLPGEKVLLKARKKLSK